jgi:hypothetical protein
MSKVVGLSRAIKQEWLDKTVEYVLQGNDDVAIKEKLNEYLSFEISSPTNLRKTREILLNIWVRSAVTAPEIHSKAIEAYKGDRSDKLALSWAMLLLAYPVFSDVTGLIGKINNLQDTFTSAWLREKLHEVWGERSTLYYSCEKILQTLKYLGAVESMKSGVYKVKRYKISDEQTISVLLMSLLALEQKAYYEIQELSRVPLFFPFEFDVSMEWLHYSHDFALENFGSKTVLSVGHRHK